MGGSVIPIPNDCIRNRKMSSFRYFFDVLEQLEGQGYFLVVVLQTNIATFFSKEKTGVVM